MRAKWLVLVAVVALCACGGPGGPHHPTSPPPHGGACRYTRDSVSAAVSPLIQVRPPHSPLVTVSSSNVAVTCGTIVTVGQLGAAGLTFGPGALCQVKQAASGDARLVTRDPVNALFRLATGHVVCSFAGSPAPVYLCGLGVVFANGQTQGTATCTDPTFEVDVRTGSMRVTDPSGVTTPLVAGQGLTYNFTDRQSSVGAAQFSTDDLTALDAQAGELALAVHPLPQDITFTTQPPASAVTGGSYTVAATGGGSGNTVTFTIDPSTSKVCTISGDTVTFVTPGTCTIIALQAGSADYAAAQAQQSMPVSAPSLQ